MPFRVIKCITHQSWALQAKTLILTKPHHSARTSGQRCLSVTALSLMRNDESKSVAATQDVPPAYRHKPSDMDKLLLVWAKKYPSTDQVPEYISKEILDKAKNKTRIYTNIIMMAITAVGCVVMIISGKRAAERGESVQQMNIDWHKSINEKK